MDKRMNGQIQGWINTGMNRYMGKMVDGEMNG